MHRFVWLEPMETRASVVRATLIVQTLQRVNVSTKTALFVMRRMMLAVAVIHPIA